MSPRPQLVEETEAEDSLFEEGRDGGQRPLSFMELMDGMKGNVHGTEQKRGRRATGGALAATSPRRSQSQRSSRPRTISLLPVPRLAFAAWATQEDLVDELDLARLVEDEAQRLCYGVFLRSMYGELYVRRGSREQLAQYLAAWLLAVRRAQECSRLLASAQARWRRSREGRSLLPLQLLVPRAIWSRSPSS